MTNPFEVGIWNIVIGSILRHGLAFFWYSPVMFGKTWLKALEVPTYKETKFLRQFDALSKWTMLYSIVLSYTMGVIANTFNYFGTPITNITFQTLIVCVGILFPVTFMQNAYDKTPVKLTLLNFLFNLISIWIILFFHNINR